MTGPPGTPKDAGTADSEDAFPRLNALREPMYVYDLPCDPRRTAVLRLLGYRKGRTPVSPETERLLQKVFQSGPTLAEPKAVWAVAPSDERSEDVAACGFPGRV